MQVREYKGGTDSSMNDLSKPWPLGLGQRRWWVTALVVLAVLAVAVGVDRNLSVWAQGWPEPVLEPLREITKLGQSDWILIPAGVLFVVTGALALLVRWKLMKTLLWQFTTLYAFIFVGVGLPSLFTTVAKRLIGRGRPMHFADGGVIGLHPNVADWTYQSFPSGHSTTVFALAAVLGFVSPRWFKPALALAVLVGVSRVGLGVHYPSDVVAGAFVGIVGAYAVRWFFARRGWLFTAAADERIVMRPLSSLRRYLALKRRGSAPVPRPDRP